MNLGKNRRGNAFDAILHALVEECAWLSAQIFQRGGTELGVGDGLASALLDVVDVLLRPREVVLMRVPEGLLLVLFVDEPEAAGFFVGAFVVRPPHSPTPVPVLTVSGAAGAKAIS